MTSRAFDWVGLVGLVSLTVWAGLTRNFVMLAVIAAATAYYLTFQREEPDPS